MKYLLTIFFLISLVYGQDYVSKWTGGTAPYTVQQSMDSIHWNNIAMVNEDTCIVPGPTFYYRIKDADSIFSNTVLVYNSLSIVPDSVRSHADIKTLSIKVKQSNDRLYFEIESERYQQMQCEVVDVVGRVMALYSFILKRGLNNLDIPAPEAHGIYILHFTTYFESVTKKIIK